MERLLVSVLTSRLPDSGRIWLDKALNRLISDPSEQSLLRSYTEASRFLGKTAVSLTADERASLKELDPFAVMDSWACDDVARVLLLRTVSKGLRLEEFAARARRCYKLGDSREQQSWLRGLCFLPGSETFVDIAIDSCRTNILPLFESIATFNPYPSRYFPELNFNQMVMKCLFNAVPLNRIVDLDRRLNAELARMAESYAREREAAGRSVPADIDTARNYYENV
jgi:hypothetical protein